MAGRSMSSAMRTEVAKAQNQPCHLFALELDSGTLYVTDAYRTVVWGGNSYAATGHLLGFDGVHETSDLQVTEARVSLSGVDQVYVSVALAEDTIDRRLRIWKGFLDTSTDAVIVDPVEIFSGQCDAPAIEEDPEAGSCTVTLTATNHFGDFTRRAGRRSNAAVQKVFFPADEGFGFVTAISNRPNEIWGRR